MNTEIERWVVVQIDEVYVNECVYYTFGKLKGFAESPEKPLEAKTVAAFSISGFLRTMNT